MPIPVSIGERAVAISAGSYHTCALTETAAVFCWGRNTSGEVGNGFPGQPSVIPVPTRVVGTIKWSEISAGGQHTCGLADDGTAYCWGLNDRGQLGVGEEGGSGNIGSPTLVAGSVRFRSVFAGDGWHSCGVAVDGRAYCWGWNNTGQLGTGRLVQPSTPPYVDSATSAVPHLVRLFTSMP